MTTTTRNETTGNSPQTWLVTGATRGLGASIARAALERGDNVLAAVRRPDAMLTLSAGYGPRLAVVEFDARDTSAASSVVQAALDQFGRIDVLVNNAGRGYVGAAEEITDAELQESLALHLFVPAALVRAALPAMRRQRSGTIVQMSSQGGRGAFPGVGAYCAGKFALEGWSEALAGEVASFGVRVMIVEPSRFRTSFNAADALAVAAPSDTYRGVLAAVREDMTSADGIQEGDPDKAARIIADLCHAETVPLRLPLGAEAVDRIGTGYRANLEALQEWAEVARAADFDDASPSARAV